MLEKKLGMLPSSIVHGGQYDSKNVTFELLLHADFVADEIRVDMLEPARKRCQVNARASLHGRSSVPTNSVLIA